MAAEGAEGAERRVMLRFVMFAVIVVAASTAVSADWPMWGGTPSRNMVSTMTGLPTAWDVKTGKNVKWVAELGSQSYGNPVVANGVVMVGTNNEAVRDPKQPGYRGVLCRFGADTANSCGATSRSFSAGPTTGPTRHRELAAVIYASPTSRANRCQSSRRVQAFHNNENADAFKDDKLTGRPTSHHLDLRHDGKVGAFRITLANCSPLPTRTSYTAATSTAKD